MKKVVKTTFKEAQRVNSRTDWRRLDSMTEANIKQAMQKDRDSAPELTEAWFQHAQWVTQDKEPVSIWLDQDVAKFLKKRGNSYHFWLNEMLKNFMRLTTGSGKGP